MENDQSKPAGGEEPKELPKLDFFEVLQKATQRTDMLDRVRDFVKSIVVDRSSALGWGQDSLALSYALLRYGCVGTVSTLACQQIKSMGPEQEHDFVQGFADRQCERVIEAAAVGVIDISQRTGTRPDEHKEWMAEVRLRFDNLRLLAQVADVLSPRGQRMHERALLQLCKYATPESAVTLHALLSGIQMRITTTLRIARRDLASLLVLNTPNPIEPAADDAPATAEPGDQA